MQVIAFGHKSRVGKDVSCRHLCASLRMYDTKLKVIHTSFASKLKRACHQMFAFAGMKEELHYDAYPDERDVKLSIGLTPVEIWIKVGMAMREIYPDIWIDQVLNEYKDVDILIISDLRFPNEVKRLREHPSTLVKLTRKEAPVRDSPADRALDSYVGWDEIYENDKSISDLYQFLLRIKDATLQRQHTLCN